MEPLLELREKLDRLVKAHGALKEQCASLQKELQAEKDRNTEYIGQIADLKNDLINSNLTGEGVLNGGTKVALQKYVDEVIKLIDKSLAQL